MRNFKAYIIPTAGEQIAFCEIDDWSNVTDEILDTIIIKVFKELEIIVLRNYKMRGGVIGSPVYTLQGTMYVTKEKDGIHFFKAVQELKINDKDNDTFIL